MSALEKVIRDSQADYVIGADFQEILGCQDRFIARRAFYSGLKFWLAMDLLAGRYEHEGFRQITGAMPQFHMLRQLDEDYRAALPPGIPRRDRLLELVDNREEHMRRGAIIGPLVLVTSVNADGVALWGPRLEEGGEELTDAELNRRMLFLAVKDRLSLRIVGSMLGETDSIVDLYGHNTEAIGAEEFTLPDRENILGLIALYSAGEQD